jgi:hypothetical protein
MLVVTCCGAAMTLKVFTVVIDCTDPRRLADFWAEVTQGGKESIPP